MSDASGEGTQPAWTGKLEGISTAELVWEICREGRTGLLRVVRHPVRRELYIQDGQIIFVASSDPNDRLGERLLRQRKITLDQLEVALGRLRTGKRLGALLVEDGVLTPEELVTAVVCQVKSVVLSVLEWERGDYVFLEGPLPTREVITLQMRTSGLLLQGLRGLRAVGRIQRRIGPARTAYQLADGANVALRELALTEGERLIVERLESGPASIEDLCRELMVGNWEIYLALNALKVLGVAEPADALVGAEQSTDREGRLSRRSLPELLVAILAAKETGVLQLHRDGVERRLHFDRGRCVFATSNDPDDGLLSGLFREGMISLADREEATRRLLSNLRVGRILRDLGVLDDQDLANAVHRQVREIVLACFAWTDGEYVFVPGELPTAEEITVDLSPEALLAEGIRRIGSWTRLVQGCGGIDEPQRLCPCYAEVLDAMDAGVEERQVASTLESQRTLRRICRTSDVDDLRVCQVVWTLRLLGAVEAAPVDEDGLDDDQECEIALGISEDPALPEAPVAAEAPEAVSASEADEVRAALRDLPAAAARGDWNVPGSPDPAGLAPVASDPAVVEPAAAAAEPITIEPAADEPSWEGPPQLDEIIQRFNAMHRVVFRAVRVEIGAGAANFVRSCCAQIGARSAAALDGVDLHADGSWDGEGLKRAVRAGRIEDPWSIYQEVLDRLYLDLTPHLGEARAVSLKEQILALQPVAGGRGGQSSP